MKNLSKIFIILLAFLNIEDSKANTLIESLNSAYLNNPKLNAERANMRASKEEKREAISEFLPSITISGYVSEQENTIPGDNTNFEPSEQSLKVEQKIFQGGAGVAKFLKQKHGQSLGEYKLKKIEQEILLEAVEAHADLLLSMKKVNINLMNVDLLERQVETDQNRLEKGEINLTDLAQSESSLAGANANLIKAKTELQASKTNFERIIREKAPSLINTNEKVAVELPNTLQEAINVAKLNNLDLLIAKLDYQIAEKDLNIEKAKLSPSASINYSKSSNRDYSSTVDELDEETVKATINWPIIKGGENISSIKKSSLRRQRSLLLSKDAENRVITETTNAWSKYQSSESVLIATEAQLKAAEIANEGITLEYDSGNTRTTLEVIQSRSLLLDSRIAFAKAERDFMISKFELAFQLGTLSSSSIKSL